MRLRDMLSYERITIQCHNNPDADALASGYGLWKYFRSQGKQVDFIYGGREEITKPNLLLFLQMLKIPAGYVTQIEEPDLLILADCQYGESNVQRFNAKELAVIDHHEVADLSKLPPLHEIRESYGSCATVVYELLKQENYDLKSDILLQTALFYGLYTDTVRLQELWHPADRDMWDELEADEGILSVLKNANIASSDLMAIGNAFIRHEINQEYGYGLAETETGDPNILGIVSDTLLEVDSLKACVVYAFLPTGIKISVRSCVKEIRADELARFVADGLGNAGGHIKKAGGFLLNDKVFPEKEMSMEERKKQFSAVLKERLKKFFDETDTIPAGIRIDLDGYRLYRKLPALHGAVELSRHYKAGTRLKVRTLEGDTDVTVSADTYLMIGTSDEPYPIEAEKFRKKYRFTGRPFEFHGEYDPTVRNYLDGKKLDLSGITQECVTTGTSYIYARQLTRRTHVFNLWNRDRYVYGKPGDYFAVMADDQTDYYIIQNSIFDRVYEEVTE